MFEDLDAKKGLAFTEPATPKLGSAGLRDSRGCLRGFMRFPQLSRVALSGSLVLAFAKSQGALAGNDGALLLP